MRDEQQNEIVNDSGISSAVVGPTTPSKELPSGELLSELLAYLSPINVSAALFDSHNSATENQSEKEDCLSEVELPDDLRFSIQSALKQTTPRSENISTTSVFNWPNIPGYSIIKNLNQGSFSKVYLARHSLSDELVAVKQISKASLNSADSKDRVFREVLIHKSISHPNICPLLEVIDTEDSIFLAMPYCAHGELYELVERKGRLDVDTCRRLFRQLVDAVHHLHSRNIVHRDLKLENLLLDSEDNLKIIDFGFANVYNTRAIVKVDCGSPEYAAPETILGKEALVFSVDIWAIGVILYTMVTGELPFHDTKLRKTFANITSISYKWPFDVDDELKDLISKIFCLSAEKRLDIAQIANHPWVSMVKESLPIESDIKRPSSDVLEHVKAEMLSKLQIKPETLEEELCRNEPTSIRALYQLLLQKYLGRKQASSFVTPSRELEQNSHVNMSISSSNEYFHSKTEARLIQSQDVLKHFAKET